MSGSNSIRALGATSGCLLTVGSANSRRFLTAFRHSTRQANSLRSARLPDFPRADNPERVRYRNHATYGRLLPIAAYETDSPVPRTFNRRVGSRPGFTAV